MSTGNEYKTCGSLGERLRQLFEEKGTSYWAREIGVSAQTINDNWYMGACPRADKLIKICTAANVSANWLLLGMGGKDLNNPNMVEGLDLADGDTVAWYRSKIDKLEEKIERLESVIEYLRGENASRPLKKSEGGM
jgi:transcriptional regulator with XRE-family HTH domain